MNAPTPKGAQALWVGVSKAKTAGAGTAAQDQGGDLAHSSAVSLREIAHRLACVAAQ